MAIGAPNAGTATTFAASTSSAVPYPTTTHAGACLLLFINMQGVNTSVTTPAGWTLIGSVLGTGATAAPSLYGFYKTAGADGTEGGTNLTVTHGGGTANRAQIVEFSGVSPVVLDVAASTVDDSVSGSTTVLTSVTSITPGCTFVYGGAQNTGTTTEATPAAGFTKLSDGTGASASLNVDYQQNVAAGATGGTITWSGSGKQVAILFALRPDLFVPTTDQRRGIVPPWMLQRRVFRHKAQPVSIQSPSVPTTRKRRSIVPPIPRRKLGTQPVPVSTPVTLTPAPPRFVPRRRRLDLLRRRQPDRTEATIGTPLFFGDDTSFETGVGGWTVILGSGALSSTQVYNGTQSLQIIASSTSNVTARHNTTVTPGIQPGDTIRYSARVFCETNARAITNSFTWRSTTAQLPWTGGQTNDSTGGPGVLGQWVTFSANIVVPNIPGINGFTFNVAVNTPVANDVFYIDDVDIRVVSHVAAIYGPHQWSARIARRTPRFPRRSQTSTPVPYLPVVTTQPLPVQPATPRRLKPTFLRRGRTVAPVLSPATAPPQALAPQPARVYRRVLPRLWHRGQWTQPVPATAASTTQALPPQPARRVLIPLRRTRRVQATQPPQILARPPATTGRHAAPTAGFLRRRGAFQTPVPVPAQVAAQAPPPQPRRRHAKPGIWQLIRRGRSTAPIPAGNPVAVPTRATSVSGASAKDSSGATVKAGRHWPL